MINSVEYEQKEARHAHLREKAHRVARHAVEQNRLAQLDGRELERVLKVAAREDCLTPALADLVLTLLTAGTLPPVAYYTLLLESPQDGALWAPLKAALLRWLVEHPAVAVAVLYIAA